MQPPKTLTCTIGLHQLKISRSGKCQQINKITKQLAYFFIDFLPRRCCIFLPEQAENQKQSLRTFSEIVLNLTQLRTYKE